MSMRTLDGRQLHHRNYKNFIIDVENGTKFQHLKKKYKLNSLELTRALFFIPYYRAYINTMSFTPVIKFGDKCFFDEKAYMMHKLNKLKGELEKEWKAKVNDVS